MNETIIAFYYRFLAVFDEVVEGKSSLFGGDFNKYWFVLTLTVVVFFIVLVVKTFLLNISILMSSTKIHEGMIQAIIRSPGSFFDSYSSGILINKFSNDLGVIDNTLFWSSFDSIEGLTTVFVAAITICQISPLLIIPTLLTFIVAITFFNYCRPAIIKTKEVDLHTKSPIFHFFGESLQALTQIRIYQQQLPRMQQFSQIINRSTQGSIGFDMVSKGFAFYLCIITMVYMVIAIAL